MFPHKSFKYTPDKGSKDPPLDLKKGKISNLIRSYPSQINAIIQCKKDLRELRKKAIRIRNLQLSEIQTNKINLRKLVNQGVELEAIMPAYLTKMGEEALKKLRTMKFFENFLEIRRVLRCSKCLQGIELKEIYKQDLNEFWKMKYLLVNLKSLQADKINFGSSVRSQELFGGFLCGLKSLEKFRHIKVNRETTGYHLKPSKPEFGLEFQIRKLKNFPIKSLNHKAFIEAFRDFGSHLDDFNGKQSQIKLVFSDYEEEDFSLQEWRRILEKFPNWESVKLPYRLKGCLSELIKNLKVYNVKIISHFDIDLILKSKCIQQEITEFLERTSPRIQIIPTGFTNENYMNFLNWSQDLYKNQGLVLSLKAIAFSPHSCPDLQKANINYFSAMKNPSLLQEFIFQFNINSLNWFNSEKMNLIRRTMELLNEVSSQRTIFEISFVDKPDKELLGKITKEISRIIHYFLESRKNKRFVSIIMKTDLERVGDLLGFLDQLALDFDKVDYLRLNIEQDYTIKSFKELERINSKKLEFQDKKVVFDFSIPPQFVNVFSGEYLNDVFRRNPKDIFHIDKYYYCDY